MNETHNDYYQPGPRPRHRGLFTYFLVALLGAVIGGLIVAKTLPSVSDQAALPEDTQQQSATTAVMPAVDTVAQSNAIIAAAEKVSPAVVGISTRTVTYDLFLRPTPVEGVGSGIILASSGYILTNDHVVQGAEDIKVILSDGREKQGRVLWTDNVMDLAVVKIDGNNLPVAQVGNSDHLRVGELAIAIGNPLGLRYQRSVTAGIISAINRSIMLEDEKVMENLIQTDASINPGNSGGPLLNAEGDVIGINTAKAPGEAMGFAIPINTAMPIVEDIIEYGKVKSPWIGVSLIDREMLSYYKDVNIEIKEGVMVAGVIQGGPAQRAGIRENDIILAVDGTKINTAQELRNLLHRKGIGSKAVLTVKRGGSTKQVRVVLSEMPRQ